MHSVCDFARLTNLRRWKTFDKAAASTGLRITLGKTELVLYQGRRLTRLRSDLPKD